MMTHIIIGITISFSLYFGLFYAPLFSSRWQLREKSAVWPCILRTGLFSLILVFFLAGNGIVNEKSAMASDNSIAHGKAIFSKMVCSACHRIQGEGAQVGPDLSYVGDKRDRKWLLAHFKDPKSVSPNSVMPPVSLPDADLEDLTSYMLSLKKGGK
ncbi:MAG: c-type cytochrome [Nitrospiria bacterium]